MKNLKSLPILSRHLVLAGILLVTAAVPAQATLVLQYLFDEGTGTTVADTGATPAANATLNGSWVADSPGAYSHSGSTVGLSGDTSLAASTSTASKLNGISAVTITGWIKLSQAPTQFDRIVGSGGLELWFDSASTLNFWNSNQGGGIKSNNINNPFVLNEWVFFASVFNGTNNVEFFTGTTSDAVSQLGGSIAASTGSSTVTTVVEIGGTPRSSSDRTPSGYFSDIRIYDETLDSTALESVRSAAIPEPGAFALLAGACAALAVLRRRR